MQFESCLNKWAGRVPPLDLSGVTVCPRETERRWHKIQPNPKRKMFDHHQQQLQQQQQHQLQQHHYQQQHHQQYSNNIKNLNNKLGNDGLPIDPRDWTRSDVWKWLTNLAQSEGLQPSPELAEKFPMNGKALCLMSLDMYLARVPIGGKMLYRDFRVRLARAMSL